MEAEVGDEEGVLRRSVEDEGEVEVGDGEEIERAPGSLMILVGMGEMVGEYIAVGRVEVGVLVEGISML